MSEVSSLASKSKVHPYPFSCYVTRLGIPCLPPHFSSLTLQMAPMARLLNHTGLELAGPWLAWFLWEAVLSVKYPKEALNHQAESSFSQPTSLSQSMSVSAPDPWLTRITRTHATIAGNVGFSCKKLKQLIFIEHLLVAKDFARNFTCYLLITTQQKLVFSPPFYR